MSSRDADVEIGIRVDATDTRGINKTKEELSGLGEAGKRAGADTTASISTANDRVEQLRTRADMAASALDTALSQKREGTADGAEDLEEALKAAEAAAKDVNEEIARRPELISDTELIARENILRNSITRAHVFGPSGGDDASAARSRSPDGAHAGSESGGFRPADAAVIGQAVSSVNSKAGSLIGTLGRVAGSVGVVRVATLALVGLVGGVVIGSLVGLIGWLAKLTAENSRFKEGLGSLKTSLGGVQEQFIRLASPLTGFLGKLSGNTMGFFARQADNLTEKLSRMNTAMGIPNADVGRRRLDALADSMGTLERSADAAVSAMERIDAANAKNESRADNELSNQLKLIDAQEKLALAEIERQEQAGDITPEGATKQRQAARTIAARERNAQRLANALADQKTREATAKGAADDLEDQERRAAKMQRDLTDAQQGLGNETPGETRARLESNAARDARMVSAQTRTVVFPSKVTDEAVKAENDKINGIDPAVAEKLNKSLTGANEKINQLREALKDANGAVRETSTEIEALNAEKQIIGIEESTDQIKHENEDRKRREQEIADQKKKADEEDAARQKELKAALEEQADEKERAALAAEKAAAAAAREAEESERATAAAAERSRFDRGSTGVGGRIDARSQRTIGLSGEGPNGEGIIEEGGVATYGRDRFGKPIDPNIDAIRGNPVGPSVTPPTPQPAAGGPAADSSDSSAGSSQDTAVAQLENAGTARAEMFNNVIAAVSKLEAVDSKGLAGIQSAFESFAAQNETKLANLRSLIAANRT